MLAIRRRLEAACYIHVAASNETIAARYAWLSRLGHTSSPFTQSGLHVILFDFDLLLRFLSERMGASREDV
jgi:hypothetical protein